MNNMSKMTTAFRAAILVGCLTLFGLTPAVHAQEVQATVLGNMGFKFETPDGHVILTDPWSGLGGFAVADFGPGEVDLILVSTAHSDNLGDTVEIAINTGATVIASFELEPHVA